MPYEETCSKCGSSNLVSKMKYVFYERVINHIQAIYRVN